MDKTTAWLCLKSSTHQGSGGKGSSPESTYLMQLVGCPVRAPNSLKCCRRTLVWAAKVDVILKVVALPPFTILSTLIIKRGIRLIRRVWSISKWPPHWIYYNLNVNISCKQPHFSHIKTYQVFVGLAHTAGMVSTCCSIADARDRSTSKTRLLSSSFFLSF